MAGGYQLVRVRRESGPSVADRCRVAQGFLRRAFGLHLLPQLEAGDGLLLRRATTIDTMFMRYPIDLVFLDADRRVTRIVHHMKPWRMAWSAHGGRDCLELPAGAAAASGVQVGEQLVVEAL